jgi:HD-like signal output (HDOD) protein
MRGTISKEVMNQPGSNSPLVVQLFPSKEIRERVVEKIAEINKRIELAGDIAVRDPVLVLELLRASNVMAVADGKAPLTNVNTALVRLGTEGTQSFLDELAGRPALSTPELSTYFEKVRSDCSHIGGLAGNIADVLARNLRDDAVSIGDLMNIGELVCIQFLEQGYVDAADGNSRAKLLYRLEKDHGIDVEKLGVNYLKRCGMPEPVLSIIDREAKPRMPARQILKPVCATAVELYYAAIDGKLDKYRPGETLPLKSTLRMMQLKDAQHKAIFEKVSEYVIKEKLLS